MDLSKHTKSREINQTKSIKNRFSHEFVTTLLDRENCNPCRMPHLATVWLSGVKSYERIFEHVWIGMKKWTKSGDGGE